MAAPGWSRRRSLPRFNQKLSMISRDVAGAVKRAVPALALAAVTLMVTIAAAELALRLFIPPPSHYAMLTPGARVFEPDARFISGVEGPAHYDVTADGFRGREFGADSAEYRILFVGGSTTECTILDYTENWTAITESALARTRDGRVVWSGNVGRSGLTARDHAVTVKFLLQQYPRIDMVVVLLGVNDLTAALRQGDRYVKPEPVTAEAAERVQVRNAFAISPEGLYRPLTTAAGANTAAWYKGTRLFDLFERARAGRRATSVEQAVGGSNLGQWRAHRQQASALLNTLPDLAAPLEEYRSNLEAIVAAAQAHGTQVVFLTQPTLWKQGITPAEERLLWLGGTGPFQEQPGQQYYTVPALASAMQQYNDLTLKVCGDHGLACFDLAAALPQDTVLLYDDVHFTEAGSALIGELVAGHLRAAKPDLFGSSVDVSAR